MTDILQALVSGVGYGSIDALLAVGLVLIFRVSGTLNFAQAGVAAVGGYVVYSVALGHLLWLAVVVGAMVGAGVSIATYGAVRQVAGARPALNSAVSTIAVAIVLQQAIRIIWGSTTGSYPSPWGIDGWTWNGVLVPYIYVAALVAALAVIGGTLLLLHGTRHGTMVRALESNSVGASLCGANVPILIAAIWAAAGVSATLGAFFAFQLLFDPSQVDTFFVGALIASVLAGLRSLGGTIVAGIGLESAKTLFGLYAPLDIAPYAETFLLVALIAVLILAPRHWLTPRGLRTV